MYLRLDRCGENKNSASNKFITKLSEFDEIREPRNFSLRRQTNFVNVFICFVRPFDRSHGDLLFGGDFLALIVMAKFESLVL